MKTSLIDFAERLTALPRFGGCDEELVRVLLHLRRADPRVRNKALMWLRCQDMTEVLHQSPILTRLKSLPGIW